jgi:hypothetical protein
MASELVWGLLRTLMLESQSPEFPVRLCSRSGLSSYYSFQFPHHCLYFGFVIHRCQSFNVVNTFCLTLFVTIPFSHPRTRGELDELRRETLLAISGSCLVVDLQIDKAIRRIDRNIKCKRQAQNTNIQASKKARGSYTKWPNTNNIKALKVAADGYLPMMQTSEVTIPIPRSTLYSIKKCLRKASVVF